MNNWRIANQNELGSYKRINGKIYKAKAYPIQTGSEFDLQVRWHLASGKEARKNSTI